MRRSCRLSRKAAAESQKILLNSPTELFPAAVIRADAFCSGNASFSKLLRQLSLTADNIFMFLSTRHKTLRCHKCCLPAVVADGLIWRWILMLFFSYHSQHYEFFDMLGRTPEISHFRMSWSAFDGWCLRDFDDEAVCVVLIDLPTSLQVFL